MLENQNEGTSQQIKNLRQNFLLPTYVYFLGLVMQFPFGTILSVTLNYMIILRIFLRTKIHLIILSIPSILPPFLPLFFPSLLSFYFFSLLSSIPFSNPIPSPFFHITWQNKYICI